jgi:hypothetical protein
VTDDRRDRSGLQISRRRALTVGGAAAVSLLASGRVPTIDSLAVSRERTVGNRPVSLQHLHDAGITGEGVDVAVLDPTGFDPNHDAIAGTIDAIRQFGDESAVVEGTSHGTAAGAAVVRLAPDARLSLASFRRPSEFVAAIEWARSRGADVILAPVAAHGTAATPRSAVYRAARRTVESGSVFVAPTGNAARGHWEGPYGALADDGSTRRRLRIRPRPGTDSVAGRFRAWLVTDPAIEIDLTLSLLRSVDDGRRWNLVALSQATEDRLGQRLVADISPGTYALFVRPTSSDGAGSTDPGRESPDQTGRVSVTTTTHALASPRPLGSIAAPASVPGVIGVGVTADTENDESTDGVAAESPSGNGVSPYSGRGPTAQGRTGVDVIAPPVPWVAEEDAGTSAAAARAAGAAALVLDAAPTLDTGEVATLLRASAGDVGRSGRDLASGAGRLDVTAAVQRARAR